jgi:hypothetical protein
MRAGFSSLENGRSDLCEEQHANVEIDEHGGPRLSLDRPEYERKASLSSGLQ